MTKATHRVVVHLATDHLLHPLLSQLTGSEVTISGRKAGGAVYENRVLDNVSLRPSRDGGISIIGMDRHSNGVRQFDLSGVQRLSAQVSPHEMISLSSDDLEALRGELAATHEEVSK